MGQPQPHEGASRSRRRFIFIASALFACALAAIPAVMAAGKQDEEKKVTICHRDKNPRQPYGPKAQSVSVNSILGGNGHAGHTGPVWQPEPDTPSEWGDIIPPFEYDGETFPGLNWSEGTAIWQNDCQPPVPPEPPKPKPIEPLLECVEPSGDGFIAHFGYNNPNQDAITPDENFFSPDPKGRNQPSGFAPGEHRDAFAAAFTEDSITWHLTGNPKSAGKDSTRCQGSITVVKHLVPSTDGGRFDLEVDGVIKKSSAGDRDTTGPVAVDAGRHTVSESPAQGTDLKDYTISIRCTGGSDVSKEGRSIDVNVGRGGSVVCTITNEAKEQPKPKAVTPELECVLFNDGQPDVAYWGYANTSGDVVTIEVGPKNQFTPGDPDRKQPTTFEEGRKAGVFHTTFNASSGSLTWTLSGNKATASAESRACNPTVELVKVTVPADDPGVFQLRIDDTVVATGGNGKTSGPLRTGIGEGTVRETAASGTNLADYDSRVECTRNGTVEVSVPGTKVDGKVAQGDVVVCTFTNTRKGTPPEPPEPPTPPTPPTPPPVPPTPPGPAPKLDLVVTKTVAPTVVTLGGRLTWTMKVINRSAVAAADVNGLKVDDPRSFRTKLISLKASQGTCVAYTCNLGRLAPGATATVTAVTEATRVGVVVDIVRVGSEEIESNYRNNVAAAIAHVNGPLTPPVALDRCETLTVGPRVLQNRRSSVVVLTARNRYGQPLAGFRIRVRGPGVDTTVRTDPQGTVRRVVLPTRVGLVFFTGIPRTLTGGGVHCRTLLGVLGASDTHVTG